MSAALIIDTPNGIEAYRLLATLHGLRIEIYTHQTFGTVRNTPMTRGMALRSAQRIQLQYRGSADKRWRTRKQAQAGMQALCERLGITPLKES